MFSGGTGYLTVQIWKTGTGGNPDQELFATSSTPYPPGDFAPPIFIEAVDDTPASRAAVTMSSFSPSASGGDVIFQCVCDARYV